MAEKLHSLDRNDPFISKILCYPVGVNNPLCVDRLNTILKYLNDVGIEGILEYGEKRVDGYTVLGKGWSSIVVLAIQGNRRVVVKIRRIDSRRKTLEHEAIILEYLRHTQLAPEPLYWYRDVIVMEFIEGLLLKDYLKSIKCSKELFYLIKDVFTSSWLLDKHYIDHSELNRPLTHVIISKSRNKPIFIDFESAKYSLHPHNLTSIASYFLFRYAKSLSSIVDKKRVVKILQLYKKTLSLKYLLELVDYLHEVLVRGHA